MGTVVVFVVMAESLAPWIRSREAYLQKEMAIEEMRQKEEALEKMRPYRRDNYKSEL